MAKALAETLPILTTTVTPSYFCQNTNVKIKQMFRDFFFARHNPSRETALCYRFTPQKNGISCWFSSMNFPRNQYRFNHWTLQHFKENQHFILFSSQFQFFC